MSETYKRLITSQLAQGAASCSSTAAGPVASRTTRSRTWLRRVLLAGGAVTLLAAAGSAVAALAPLAALDKDLIDLCSDLVALERRIGLVLDLGSTDADALGPDAAQAAAYLIDLDQRKILDRVCVLTPRTREGCIALAAALAVISPGLLDASPESSIKDRPMGVLLRGLRTAA